MTKKRSKILYAASTAQHLHRFHEPYIAALREEYDVMTMGDGEGVTFPVTFRKKIFSFANFRTMLRIRRILRREKFDKIILNTTLAAFWIRLALPLCHRPQVLNIVHGYLFSLEGKGLKRRIYLLCERMLRRRTDEIAVMNLEDEVTATRYRLCRGEVHFINGMGIPEKELPRPSGASRRPEDPLRCTYVGELSGRKNQIFLVRSVKQMKERGIPIRLLLVGEGSARAELAAEIERLGLEQEVILAGSRSDVPRLLSMTDLYLSASLIEGLPFNLMEAMEHGLPILATASKGQTDLLSVHPEMLYDIGDMEALVDGVGDIYKTGICGPDTVAYPELEKYRLQEVFATNLQMMKTGLDQNA